MASSERVPWGSKVPSLHRGVNSSRTVAQSILLRSEKERHGCWSSFPRGQKTKGTFPRASSHLLQQLIHRSQESDADGEEDQGEEDSEDSSESEMLNLEEEFDGVLREEVVAEALHELGRSGPGTEQVYLNLSLSGRDLIDISILCGYVHLQKLDLSVNKIEDLSCVSCMPYLLELNASQNKLTTFFNFKPPKNLKKVDFSYNQISEMCDLLAYHALTKLILDNNEIEEISGLEMCISLTHLSLSNNKITTISGLNMLPIKILCLSNNLIDKITGLEDLKALQNLDLSHNQISSLQGLENHDFLEVINLEDNKIAELSEIEYIENLPILRILNLLKNPIQEKPEYWYFVIYMLLRLTDLDQKKIKVEEKVAAVNKYDPPPEVVAAQDHLTHVVNSVMQPQRIFDSTLPSLDAPYPMLILAGPQACGKRELAHRLCRQFNTYFRYGACHTTRPPYFGEGDRVDYHFISQEVFDEMLNMGKFILTFNYGNHSYGLSRDTVEGIARDGLASCIHMEIEGVRSLKYTYFEPRYILVVPMNKEKYEGHLRRKGLFSRAEIECAVSRVDLYIKINQKFPGYFDAVINADDMDAAYQKLSQLIREYLGLTEEPAKSLAPTAAGTSSSKKTVSGVPAHLVPSPRRLAKLQADGQITEHLSGVQIHGKVPEDQNSAPSQSQELTQGGETHQKEIPPNSHLDAGPPQLAQDTAPNPVGEGAQPSSVPPKIVTTEADVPENEAGLSPAPQQPDPAAPRSSQPDRDAESGEAKASSSGPPLPEAPQGPGPASLGPQEMQDEEPSSPQHEPPGGSQPPPKGETPKAHVARVGTPYPELPPPPDSSANTKQSQDREHPVALLPRSRLAPTRLPQPQTLAPLQSRRPTPKLLSPSREELGTSSDQTATPSPRPLLAQEGESGKLPPISPPHPKPPPNLSPDAAHSPQRGQEEKAGEVKLPLISPPVQEQAPHAPNSSQDPTVRLPRIPTPLPLVEAPQSAGARPGSKPARDRKALPGSQEPVQQKAARKKKLPLQRDTAKAPAPQRKALPGRQQTALQPEPQPEPASASGPGPSPPLSPQGIPELPHAEPSSKDPQSQEKKRERVPHARKKAQTNVPQNDLRTTGAARKRPSLKREIAEASAQKKQTALRGEEPAPEGGLPPQSSLRGEKGPAEAGQDPGAREHAQKKGRPAKREMVSEPAAQESSAPAPRPARETVAPRATSQIREPSVPRDSTLASRQHTREKRARKNGGAAQDSGPGASAEEQAGRSGRLRARGSQSTKV